MPISVNIFNGKLNLDVQHFRVAKGDYVDALNITRDAQGEGQDDVVSNILGNQKVSYTLPAGINKVIGNVEDAARYRIYYFVWNSNGNGSILYYDGITNAIVKVYEDKTDSGGEELLSLNPSVKIILDPTCILYSNDGDILSFLDGLKRPSQINIDKALSGFYGVWQRSFFDVAKEPPSCQPVSIYVNNNDADVNNFKKRLFKFRYRYVFENGEKSVYSAISELALPYDSFNPDEDTDPSKNAEVQMILQTGALNVVEIELVGAAVSNNNFNDWFLISSLNKSDLSLPNNDTFIFSFRNDKAYPAVDVVEVLQPYDYVPLEANAQAFANGNTREYGGITEGYDKIPINVTLTPSWSTAEELSYQRAILYAFPIGNNIHITVISSEANEYEYNINTTNELISYQALNTDDSADIINGIASAAIALGFTVVSSDDNNLYITKTGEKLEDFYIGYEDITPFSGIAPVYDIASKTGFGLVYFDSKGRTIGGVLANDDMNTQWIMEDLKMPAVVAKIYHRPPIDAEYYQWVRTKDLAKKRILWWLSDVTYKDSDYAYISLNSLNQYIADNPSTSTQLGYTFTQSDRIKFIRLYSSPATISHYYNNSSKDFEILSVVVNPIINGITQIGSFVKINLPTTDTSFDFGEKAFQNYLFELYTPAQPLADNLNIYFEYDQISYRILDAHTDNRRHQGQTKTQSADLITPAEFLFTKGDYYFRPRTMYAAPELKYTIQTQDISNADFIPMTVENAFSSLGWTAQSTISGHLTGDIENNDNWIINVTDGDTYTFHIKGTIVIKAVNGNSDTYKFQIYVVDPSGTENITDLFTINGLEEDKTYTFDIDRSIVIPAGFTKMFLLGDSEPTKDGICKTTSGLLTITLTQKSFPVNIISNDFSDFYPSAVNSNGRSWSIEPNAKKIYNPVLIRFSREYNQDTSVNDTNKFFEENFIEVDRSEGDIQRMFIDQRRLYVLQRLNVGVVPVLVQVIIDNANNPLEANSDLLLNKVQYPYTGKYGIADEPTAFAYGKGVMLFADTNKKTINAFAFNSNIVPVSVVYEMNAFFVSYLEAYRKDLNNGFGAIDQPYTGDPAIYISYNQYTNRFVIVLEEINRYNEDGELIFHQDAKTITFVSTEKHKGFESMMSFHPENIGTLNTLNISFLNGELWIHNSDTYCNFYGTQYDCFIKGVFNDAMIQKKSWIGITQEANEVWDCPEITTQSYSYGNTHQLSKLPASRFRLMESQYQATLLRDMNSRGGLINGTFLKGSYMIITFRKENAATFVFLNCVGIKYLNSQLIPN